MFFNQLTKTYKTVHSQEKGTHVPTHLSLALILILVSLYHIYIKTIVYTKHVYNIMCDLRSLLYGTTQFYDRYFKIQNRVNNFEFTFSESFFAFYVTYTICFKQMVPAYFFSQWCSKLASTQENIGNDSTQETYDFLFKHRNLSYFIKRRIMNRLLFIKD